MIRVSLNYLVLIFLVLMLAPIAGAWLIGEWKRLRRERAAFRHVLRCRLCAGEFLDATDVLLPRCPHCGAVNERRQPARL
jgi:hypothetical protein